MCTISVGADAQNVPIVMDLLYNRKLQHALVELGYVICARSLRVMAGAYQA